MGTRLSFVFKWVVNGSQLTSYSFDPSDTFPRNISTRSGIKVQITRASINKDNTATYDIISTLRSDASIIGSSRVRCENNNIHREIVIGDIIRGKYVSEQNMDSS